MRIVRVCPYRWCGVGQSSPLARIDLEGAVVHRQAVGGPELPLHDAISVRREFGDIRLAAPSHECVATVQELQPALAGGKDVGRRMELLKQDADFRVRVERNHHAGGIGVVNVGIGVAVGAVVKEGDDHVSVILGLDARVVLEGERAIEVVESEIALLAVEAPDDGSVSAIDHEKGGEEAAGDRVVAVLGLVD